ncbi:cobalt-precorrin-6A reductase [Oleispirillum naphthae]|uniref:cobalt-precorrin-6A reductase n=1 Tax=Oleispirillum naphthae TaxID=2838853 RepID=UPI0030826331
MPDREPPRILILGGTADAAAIAASLVATGTCRPLTSLAGRVKSPQMPPGEVRIGGFGGAEGLRAFLTENRIKAVIDATHPFAAQISANARAACDAAGVPRLQVRRPEWPRHPADRWVEADSTQDAAQRLPALGRRAFLTVGVTELQPFRNLADTWCLVRVVDPPEKPLLDGPHRTLAARGPFAEEAERALMSDYAIDVLVTKHAGGNATYGKLAAARGLGIPVLMIRRPAAEPGDTAQAEDALAWLRGKRLI